MIMRPGRPPLPREHGAWAMLVTPPLAGMLALGPEGLSLGLPTMAGWFLAYTARGPVEVLAGRGASGRAGMAQAEPAVARFWLLLLALLSAACLLPVALQRPATLMLLTGAALILGAVYWLAAHGETRSLPAGLLAVAGLTAGGPLYYLAATGSVGPDGWALAYGCFAFFGGSVFRVKALARERRSARFRWLSVAIHAALALGALPVAGPLLALSLTPSTLWALHGALRGGHGPAANLGAVGKAEIWQTILFALLLIISLRVTKGM